jgi:predicted RNA binding protein YcfA (HicA-like mRNA interferase family)
MGAEVRFAELRRRLEAFGCRLVRISGSHHIFVGAGRPLVSVPVHRGRVKRAYVAIIEGAIAKVLRTSNGRGE